MTLAGRVALVTGSTRGIGWATARLLAERGAAVVVTGVASQDAVDARVAELPGDGHTGLCFDVADAAATQAAVKQVFAAHRRLDVLVNNAGVLQNALLGMAGEDVVSRLFSVNAVGTLNTMQAAARLLARDGGGAVVNLTSIVGIEGNPGQVAYAGAKAAVIGMTRAAAKELGPQGVRVNAVAPGYIATDMMEDLAPEARERQVAAIAAGRAGTPEDVARVIAFLASDDAEYVTGQVLGVDGGMVI